jgi:twinkle protein
MTTEKNESKESNLIGHGPCASCGSSDAVGIYDDGHGWCFSCSTFHKEYDGKGETPKPATQTTTHAGLTNVEYTALPKRGLNLETCRKWQYQVGSYNGRPVQIANYLNGSDTPITKVRFQNKDFLQIGKGKLPLYGQWLWERKEGKMLTVTEGEIDAMSVSQLQEHKWPVVSIPNGAAGAVKAFKDNLEFLERFETVVLLFDNDKVGKEAAEKCSQLLTVGKARIASLPLKDANDMLVNKRGAELIQSLWNAKAWRPDGIVAGEDLWESINKEEQCISHMYPWPSLNDMTMGIREGEIVTMCAGSGIGKSSVCKEIAYHLLSSGVTTGYIALEESTKRTALGIMGLHINKPIYLNPAEAKEEELKEAFDATVGSGNYFTYDHWGSLDEGNLLSKIRYLVTAVGCKVIFLDHLSIVVSGMEGGDERRMIDNVMTKLRSLVEELKFGLILVSHLKRPEGKGHEDGARTSLAQLRGSAGIAQLSDMVIGMERDQQDVETSKRTTIRILKNRWCGKNGIATILEFDEDTGRLAETEYVEEEEPDEKNDF